ncbi:Cytochrome P450 CYP2 subfamily [Handroanthus impetiginosus]|uniref:Cytochrome P450 CYP2 subfamily n=1 Tax=Handroanthus impetiginosus TaxID=429701 RepID=A0A2G9GGG6_9LAMI|nr:Cytochrome P450 CYP2 subfamily [Handroanthus impetiginosus]
MDEFALSPLTLFLLLAFLLSCSWIISLTNSKKQTPPSPPGPYGLPILGYLPFLQPNLHYNFTKLAYKYGPIYKLRLGTKLCIVISSPSLIKEVVRDQDAIFANRDPPVAALVATGGGLDIAWSPYGPYWRDMRKLFVHEMLSNKNIQASYLLRKGEVRKMVRNLRCKIGEPFNIGEVVFLTAVNVITNLLWGGMNGGGKWDRLGGEFREKLSKLMDLFGKPNVSDFIPCLGKFDVEGIEKDMREVLSSAEEILDVVVGERMKIMKGGGECRGERRRDFLEILFEGLTQKQIVKQDSVLGGTDTTATTVEWVMTELLDKPHVMEKVQQELTGVVGVNNIVEESHISKLHYLDAVVKETFRLHPPLPLLIPRSPSQSCTVGGYTIPKGSRVFLNMWSISMDPQLWENPLEFHPNRFLNDTRNFDYMGNNFQYLPFGSGRRMCPGLPLGEKMVMYLLATLIHSFEWRLPEGEMIDLSEKFGFVMRKSKPLQAIPYQRLPYLNLYE